MSEHAKVKSDGVLHLSSLSRHRERLSVPCPPNPARAQADAHTLDVASRLGVIHSPEQRRRYHGSRFGDLTATAYSGASPEVLALANDWHYWLWSFDDRTDNRSEDLAQDPARHARVVAALVQLLAGAEGPGLEDDVHVAYLSHILDGLRRVSAPGARARFCTTVTDYLLRGTLAGAKSWADHRIEGLEAYVRRKLEEDKVLSTQWRAALELSEYTEQRLHEGAYYTVQPFIELSSGVDLPDEVLRAPGPRRAMELVNLMVIFVNDVFSYEKEVLLNGNPNNLLHVLMVHEALPLTEAVARCAGLLDGYQEEVSAIEASFTGQPAVLRLLEGHRRWLCASYDWHLQSGRYRTANSPFAELRS